MEQKLWKFICDHRGSISVVAFRVIATEYFAAGRRFLTAADWINHYYREPYINGGHSVYWSPLDDSYWREGLPMEIFSRLESPAMTYGGFKLYDTREDAITDLKRVIAALDLVDMSVESLMYNRTHVADLGLSGWHVSRAVPQKLMDCITRLPGDTRWERWYKTREAAQEAITVALERFNAQT